MTYRTEDGIYVRLRETRDGKPKYVVEAKRVPFVSPEGESEFIYAWNDDLWFEFGDYADDAIRRVLLEARIGRTG